MKKAIKTIMSAIERAGFTTDEDVYIGMDVASTEFFKDGKYHLEGEGKSYTSAQFVDLLASWADKYPIITIEDGCSEDDWEGWKLLTERLGGKVQLVGDDLFVTNTQRLSKGIADGIGNSILIKVNQIGTLTETFDASKWRSAQDIQQSSLIAQEKAKTVPSLILQ